MPKTTHRINDVEIFAVGIHNGDSYTLEDLKEMERAFNETKSTFRPFLKLGHSKNQKLLANEGLPAAGWLENVRVVGEKLICDFVDIPKKIFELIQQKTYRKVSSEIYLNCSFGEKVYNYLVGAVAILGAESPGVSTLSDILGLYNLSPESIKTYQDLKEPKTYELGKDLNLSQEEIMTEQEIKELKDQLAAKDAEAKQFKADAEAAAKKAEEAEGKIKELEVKNFSMKIEGQVESLISEGLITKGMAEYAKEFLGEEKKEYAFKEEKMDKFGLFKAICKEFKAVSEINLKEKTVEGDKKDHKCDEMEEKIQKYMKDNKADYAAAYKAVMKQKK